MAVKKSVRPKVVKEKIIVEDSLVPKEGLEAPLGEDSKMTHSWDRGETLRNGLDPFKDSVWSRDNIG